MSRSNKKSGRRRSAGFRNPPQHFQFAPGQSGNPKGRPKGSKNFATVIKRELNKSVVATEGGKPRRLKKRDAVVMQLVHKAAGGDIKATSMLLQEERQREDSHQSSSNSWDLFDRSEDLMVIASVIERIRKSSSAGTTGTATVEEMPKQEGNDPLEAQQPTEEKEK